MNWPGYPTPQDESLNDTWRVNYLNGFLENLLNAVRYDLTLSVVALGNLFFFHNHFMASTNCAVLCRNGSNARGYFTWSFLDVFELLDGYQSRYGLYHVDFQNKDLKRLPKLSAHWYSNFLKKSQGTTGINKIHTPSPMSHCIE